LGCYDVPVTDTVSAETVWRYLSFPKFVSLLELRALWMCRLGVLEDQFEGTLPEKTWRAMVAQALEWRETFPQPELQKQLATMTDRNVDDGRRVLVVNCWFSGARESGRMWEEYSDPTSGVAIRSTLTRLDRSILAKQEFTKIGRVRYVDFSNHDMGTYEGHQAPERALLKRLEYSHESEVRIITMNVVCPGTLNADGMPPTATQLAGPGSYDPNRPGLYLLVDLNVLIEAVVTAPRVSPRFHDLVSRLCKRYQIAGTVERSALSL
jgi:hypothetical protein